MNKRIEEISPMTEQNRGLMELKMKSPQGKKKSFLKEGRQRMIE